MCGRLLAQLDAKGGPRAMISEVRTVRAPGIDDAVATIVMAFAGDPVARWSFPATHEYLTHFPRLVRAFAGRAAENGTAFSTARNRAVALWLPSGVEPDGEQLESVLAEALTPAQAEEVQPFVEHMAGYHPKDPVWYLPMIGVDPVHQGQGYGSALLRHTLDLCDQQAAPAYLESTNPRNNPLYERHGFEVIGLIQTDSSPPMWPMLRKPR